MLHSNYIIKKERIKKVKTNQNGFLWEREETG